MNRIANKMALVLGLACFVLSLTALASVNESISIDDGEHSDGAGSVNGSITVGDNATVTGRLRTVNGKIRIGSGSVVEDAQTVNGRIILGDNVSASSLETVNGSIDIPEGVGIDGGVSAVNGSITLGTGSRVGRDVSNVNGKIELTGSEVGRDLRTVAGDVELSDAAAILGDLVVEKPRDSGWFNWSQRSPRIVIGPGCRVDGSIRLEREVKLFISESASVGGVEGVMALDDAEIFSGNRP